MIRGAAALLAAAALCILAGPPAGAQADAADAEFLDPVETTAEAYAAYGIGDFQRALMLAELAGRFGAPDAMRLAGLLRTRGLGGTRDDAAAVDWLTRAAEIAPNSETLLALGLLGLDGRGGLSMAEAAGYLEEAADLGSRDARFELAAILAVGAPGVPADPARARGILSQDAADGSARAQGALGILLLDADPDARDVDEAVRWLTLAADAGDRDAAFRLGALLVDDADAPHDPTRGRVRLEAAALAGHPRAAALLGVAAAAAGEAEEAVTWWRRAADGDDPLGQYYLAVALARGDGVRANRLEAFRHLIRSEAAGPLEHPDDAAARAGLIAAFEADLGAALAADLRARALEPDQSPSR